MKKCSKMMRKALSLACGLAMALSMLPGVSAAETGPVKSNNKNKQDYTTYASTVKSYLYENASGGLTRVEYTGGQVVIEDYDSSFRYLSGRTIAPELPLWGGFYAGESYNFLVFGQKNPGENNSVEVIRVVKYDKNWNRLGSASLKGANTTVPFDAGSLRCAEYGGYLYIRTCHTMYKYSDGLNHQSNMMLAIRQSDMAVTDSFYDIWNTDYGYVSHSFNQHIIIDEDGLIVSLDHGDSSPRAVTFMRYYNNAGQGKFSGRQYGMWCCCGEMLTFAGAGGNNTTGGSVGGLAETSDCYIMTYNYDGAGRNGDRYPYYHFMDKPSGRSWSVRLTNTPGATTPVLASTGLNGGYVMWNGKSGYTIDDTLSYIHYDAKGKIGQIQTDTAALSDCQPIFYQGKVTWYATDNSVPTFYQLDNSGVTAVAPDGSRVEEEPEVPTVPVTPDEPGTPSVPETPDEPEVPSVPETPDEPEVPSVPETPDKPEVPSVPETPDKPETPSVPETPSKPNTSNTTKQPTTSNTTKQPTTSNTTKQPTTSNTTKQPTASSTTKQPTTSNTTKQPTTSSTTKQPTTSNTTKPTASKGNAVSFSDVRSGDWFKTVVDKVSEHGLMNGMGGGVFNPHGNLTIAQALVLAYQIDSGAGGALTAQDGEAWYMPYYRYCLNNGILTAGQVNLSDFDKTASRYDMVSILDQAVPASRMTAVKTVNSVPDLAESAPHGNIVYKWYRAGILNGDDAGRFNGSSNITRAEVAVILCTINNLV